MIHEISKIIPIQYAQRTSLHFHFMISSNFIVKVISYAKIIILIVIAIFFHKKKIYLK